MKEEKHIQMIIYGIFCKYDSMSPARFLSAAPSPFLLRHMYLFHWLGYVHQRTDAVASMSGSTCEQEQG